MTVEELRRCAIHNSLFRPTTLGRAIKRLAFVQADPIRSPARAQDLILRQRATDYRAGDLEKKYPKLNLEEDVLYAYGFVSRPIQHLLYPRQTKKRHPDEDLVLDVVRKNGVTHPKELSKHLDAASKQNAWGGSSKATTHALENLHRRGLLRIAKREKGIRLYEIAPPIIDSPLSSSQRYQKLVMIAANIFAPTTEQSIHSALAPLRRMLFGKTHKPLRLDSMVDSGALRREAVDGISYLWPSGTMKKNEAPRIVRILAPFDPLIWNRKRFEHFWGWPYRFEAYTPIAKRVRGYYAMPMLWGDEMIGWANIDLSDEKLNVDLGFIGKRPSETLFRQELDAEIERIRQFLTARTITS